MERRHRSHRYNVSYAGTKGHERGMIFLDMPGTKKRDRLPPPFTWAKVHIEGEEYWGRFVKIALNVVKKEPTESRLVENMLPSILLDWFGREGILPGGKSCHVAIDPIEGKPEEFTLKPCRQEVERMNPDLKDLGFEPSAELVLLGDEVKLNVSRFSSEKGVYAMVLDGVVKYVGQTKMEFSRRMYFYSNPGSRQQTNIRVNELLRRTLSGTPSQKCEVWFIPDARIERGRFKVWLGEPTLEGSPDQKVLERVLIRVFNPEWNRN